MVTGSLIPQTQIETFVPVTVITADDIQARGFSSVSDVLQKSSFATGGVQGAQIVRFCSPRARRPSACSACRRATSST